MSRSDYYRSVAAVALVLTFSLAIPGSSYAQKAHESETGGAAGYSPPIDAPDADARMQSRSIEPPPEVAPGPDAAVPADAPEKKQNEEKDPSQESPTK